MLKHEEIPKIQKNVSIIRNNSVKSILKYKSFLNVSADSADSLVEVDQSEPDATTTRGPTNMFRGVCHGHCTSYSACHPVFGEIINVGCVPC